MTDQIVVNEPQSALQGVLCLNELLPGLLHAVRLEQQPELQVVQERSGYVQEDEGGVRLRLILDFNRLLMVLFELLDEGMLAVLLLHLEFVAAASIAEAKAALHRLVHVMFHFFDRGPFHHHTPL